MRRLLWVLPLFYLSIAAPAITFTFDFDPDIGTGILELQTDPGSGEFDLASQTFSLEFNFPAYGTFSEEDILSMDGVKLFVSKEAGARRLQFGGVPGGIFGGAPTLQNDAGVFLSFDPNTMVFFRIDSPTPELLELGRYLARAELPVPEAGATAMLLGFAGAALAFGRARTLSGRRC